MRERVVMVEGVRTPIGRYGSTLKDVSSGFLASHVIAKLLERTAVAPEEVDEVIFGEVRQTTESSNIARVAAIRANIPVEVPAFTVNRLCASGMQAITSGVQQIQSEQAEIVIAGGAESMSNSPIYLRNSRFGGDNPFLMDSHKEAGQQPKEIYGEAMGMGITAENVAESYHVSREDQDAFAVESQQRTAKAIREGKFKEEIVPIEVVTKKGMITFEQDEHPRPDATFEKLQQLPPVFKEGGTVTAGNACGRNDGASAVLLMTESAAERHHLHPLAAIVDWAVIGVDPEVMGMGPVPAIRKLLERTHLKMEDISLFEINEAFASQTLAVQRELGIEEAILNVNGGAIALGHPVGSSGNRIVLTLANELKRRGERYGIAALCVGGGQGMAILIGNLSS